MLMNAIMGGRIQQMSLREMKLVVGNRSGTDGLNEEE